MRVTHAPLSIPPLDPVPSLMGLQQDSSTALAAVERERAKAAAAREAVEAPARALAAAIQGQGYKVTRPQVGMTPADGDRKPHPPAMSWVTTGHRSQRLQT